LADGITSKRFGIEPPSIILGDQVELPIERSAMPSDEKYERVLRFNLTRKPLKELFKVLGGGLNPIIRYYRNTDILVEPLRRLFEIPSYRQGITNCQPKRSERYGMIRSGRPSAVIDVIINSDG
jgi:hypothetical protein